MLVKPDFETVQKSLRWNCPTPENIVELRTLTIYRGQASVGYFNDPVLAANAIVNGDNEGVAGAYATLNPVIPEAFARCSNRMVSGRAAVFTHDSEILERRGLLLDFDPVRLSGISSTNEEHKAALERMEQTADTLAFLYGFPAGCLIDSGNGAHAKYLLERMANDQESTNLIKTALQIFDQRYSDSKVTIDKSVFNASRIVRIPGTVARKGENTPERPHRVSRIIRDYDPFHTLTRATLERFVTMYAGGIPKKTISLPSRRAEYPTDEAVYRALNNISRDRFHEWVPHLLGDLARPSGEGYRIASRDLGRDLEEDIYIGPTGIKDFGVADMGDATEGRRTALSLLVELGLYPSKREAAAQLSMTLNVPMNEFEGKALQDPAPQPVSDDPVVMPEALMGRPAEYRGATRSNDFDALKHNRLRWLIQDFVYFAHYTVITAPPKIGKSTLSRMMAASLVTGLPFLNRPITDPVGVLYIAYEDREGDMVPEVHRYIKMLIREAGMDPNSPEGFKVFAEARRRFVYIAEGDGEVDYFDRVPRGGPGLQYLRGFVADNPDIKVMFVDPIRFLRDDTMRSRNIVDQEYMEGLDFKAFAQETGVAVVGLHHSNKESGKKSSEGNDPLTGAGGTAAVTGAAGNVIQFQGDRIPDGIEGHIGLYRAGRTDSPKQIMVTPRNHRFYLSPPGSEIFFLRKLTPASGGGGGGARPGPRTEGPSGSEVDNLIVKYLSEKKVATKQLLSDTLNVKDYTIESRLKVMREKGIVERFEEEMGLFKTPGPGGKPFVYRLTEQVRLPD